MMIFMKAISTTTFLWMLFSFSAGNLHNNTVSTRIVGGDLTDIYEHPYLAQVYIEKSFQCAGVIISEDWVLTAGKCVYGLPVEDLKILAGSSCLSEGTSHNVKKVLMHYDFDGELNNIVLIQVAPNFIFSEYVQYIQLADYTDIMIKDTPVIVLGWGATMENGDYSYQLRKVTLHTMTNEMCQELLPGSKVIPGMFCAMDRDGGKGDCEADEGGPVLNEEGILVGIVSTAEGCGRPRFPSIYTRITFYRKWIETQTGI